MKLARFDHGGRAKLGVVVEEDVIDLAEEIEGLPHDMASVLATGPELLDRIRALTVSQAPRTPLSEVRLLPPVERPPKFLAIGANYVDHAAEGDFELPEHPIFFNKQSTCVNGPYDPILKPRISDQLDYEGELGFVVGRRCRYVPRERAAEVIGGYVVINDVSVRDWQLRTATWTLGKSWDSHGPFGPWIVTPEDVPDPHALELRTWVNGDLRQSANTRDMIYDCFAQVETLSTVFTLEPGDLVATGTPAGVGLLMSPPRLLAIGDVVRVEVSGLGAIENTVIDEPDDIAMIGGEPQ